MPPPSAAASQSAPLASKRAPGARLPAGSAREAHTAPATPMGRFTRKMARHENCWTSSPPMGGPAVSPAATTLEIPPSARPRCSRGKMAVSAAGAIDIMPEAPSAWTMRAPTSMGTLVASPHRPEPSVKSSMPPTKTRRWPSTSPCRPEARSVELMTSR